MKPMPPDDALTCELVRLDIPELFSALRTVGAIKLQLRREAYAKRGTMDHIIENLSPYNKRVDSINKEMEWRTKEMAETRSRNRNGQ